MLLRACPKKFTRLVGALLIKVPRGCRVEPLVSTVHVRGCRARSCRLSGKDRGCCRSSAALAELLFSKTCSRENVSVSARAGMSVCMWASWTSQCVFLHGMACIGRVIDLSLGLWPVEGSLMGHNPSTRGGEARRANTLRGLAVDPGSVWGRRGVDLGSVSGVDLWGSIFGGRSGADLGSDEGADLRPIRRRSICGPILGRSGVDVHGRLCIELCHDGALGKAESCGDVVRHALSRVTPRRSRDRRRYAKVARSLSQRGPGSRASARVRPRLADLGHVWINIGQTRPDVGPHRPMLFFFSATL